MAARPRPLVLAGLLLAAAVPATHGQVPVPDSVRLPTVVIVHGAWGGSWAFRRVDSLLSARGRDVLRPSLTGLGERVHLATPEVGLGTHIDDVVNAILFEGLRDVVLVGHSYGGMVVTGVADRLPERVRRVVYLDAFVPDDGESVVGIQGERAGWIAAMTRDGLLVPPWAPAEAPPPKDVPQPLRTFTDPIRLTGAGRRLPATYVLTVESGKPAAADDFAAQADRARRRGWPVVVLAADHNPQWSAPAALADLLGAQR